MKRTGWTLVLTLVAALVTDAWSQPLPEGALMRLGTLTYTSRPRSIDRSPDGTQLAVGYTDGSLRVWDMNSAELVFEAVDTGQSDVYHVAFSPDGQSVLAVDRRQGWLWWSLDGARERVVDATKFCEESLADCTITHLERWRSQDSVVAISDDQTLSRWSLSTGERTAWVYDEEIEITAARRWGDVFWVLSLPNNGESILTAFDPELNIINTYNCPHELDAITLSPDGSHVAVYSDVALKVCVWPVDAPKERKVLDISTRNTHDIYDVYLKLSTDGRFIRGVTTGHLRDLGELEPVEELRWSFDTHTGEPGGQNAKQAEWPHRVSPPQDAEAISWYADRFQVVVGETRYPRQPPSQHRSWVSRLQELESGHLYAYDSYTAITWDINTGGMLSSTTPPLRYTPFPTLSVTVTTEDPQLEEWDPDCIDLADAEQDTLRPGSITVATWDGQALHRIEAPRTAYEPLLEHEGHIIVCREVFDEDTTAHCGAPEKFGEAQLLALDPETGVMSAFGAALEACPRPEGVQLAAGRVVAMHNLLGPDRHRGRNPRLTATVIELSSGKVLLDLKHLGQAGSVALSEDGSTVAINVWGRDSHLEVWDVDTRELLLTAPQHHDDLALSPRGTCLAAVDPEDKTQVVLLTPRRDSALRKLAGHEHSVSALSFSRDGQRLYTAGHTILVWDLGSLPSP